MSVNETTIARNFRHNGYGFWRAEGQIPSRAMAPFSIAMCTQTLIFGNLSVQEACKRLLIDFSREAQLKGTFLTLPKPISRRLPFF